MVWACTKEGYGLWGTSLGEKSDGDGTAWLGKREGGLGGDMDVVNL